MAPSERSQDISISSLLARQAEARPSAPFLLSGDAPLSYAEVERQAGALAASLANLGVGAGDRVALVLPAWPEFAIATFAAAKLHAPIVPLDPRLSTADLRYRLRHCGAKCAISAEDADGTDYLQVFEDLLVALPELEHVVTVGKEDLWHDDRIFQWEDLVSAGEGRDFSPPPDPPSALFAILYTSGVSAKPKGVELSHANVLHAAGETVAAAGVGPSDVVAGVTALFHVFGLGPGLVGTMMQGASLALQDGFDAAETLRLVERHRATVHYGVPTLFAMELDEAERRGGFPDSVRVCVASGAPVRQGLAQRVEQGFGAPLLVAYSLTEAASTLAVTRPEDPPDKRASTLGRPVADTRVRVAGDDGETLPVESVGEIWVRGPGMMRGYHRQPNETAQVLDAAGHVRTGDIGMIDAGGYIHLVGRRDDVIIRGGYNVHPSEVEDRLVGHPAVDRAAVVGVPDDVLGDAICACVVLVEGGVVTPQELREWGAATLAAYKLPDSVTFMADLPLTTTGKVSRVELARLAALDGPDAQRQNEDN